MDFNNYIDYPDIRHSTSDPSDPNNFFKTLYRKNEFHKYFAETEDRPREEVEQEKCKSISYNIKSVQRVVENFLSPLTPYNSLHLFWGTGEGKTCGTLRIAENFYDHVKQHNTFIYIITKGLIQQNFLDELVGPEYPQCAGTKYLNEVSREVMKRKANPLWTKAFIENAEKKVQETYQLYGYLQFKNRVDGLEDSKGKIIYKKLTDLEIKEKFNNSVIIVDEIHKIKSSSDPKETKAYDTLVRVLKTATNIKFITTSATPTWDNPNEILDIINLFLINDRRPIIDNPSKIDLFDENDLLTDDAKNLIINNCKGYFSYVKGEDPYTFPKVINEGDTLVLTDESIKKIHDTNFDSGASARLLEQIKNNLNYNTIHKKYIFKPNGDYLHHSIQNLDLHYITVVSCNNGLYHSVGELAAKHALETKKSKDKYNLFQRITNIIFPNSVNEKIINQLKTVNLTDQTLFNNSAIVRNFVNLDTYKFLNDEISSYFKLDKLQRYSSKYFNLINHIVELTKDITEGKLFLHTREKTSDGIPIIAAILSANGFVKYSSTRSSQNVDYKTFAVLHGGITPRDRQKILKSYNGPRNNYPDNRTGKYIKILLATDVLVEGVNLYDTVEEHILNPWWNLSKIDQIKGRGARFCSTSNISTKTVKVFKYMTTMQNYGYKVITKNDKKFKRRVDLKKLYKIEDSDIDYETIDQKKYTIAINKDFKFKQIERILKENSFDCSLNKNINVPKSEFIRDFYDITKLKGTRECDYQNCDYVCSGFNTIDIPKLSTDQIDYSTYDIIHAKDEIINIKNIISDMFSQKFAYTLDEITDNVYLKIDPKFKNSIQNKLIYLTLTTMIDNREIVYNKYSKRGFIIHRGPYYIFNEDSQPLQTIIEKRVKPPKSNVVKTTLDFLTESGFITESEKIALTTTKKKKREKTEDKIKTLDKLNRSLDTIVDQNKIIDIVNNETTMSLKHTLIRNSIYYKLTGKFDKNLKNIDSDFYKIMENNFKSKFINDNNDHLIGYNLTGNENDYICYNKDNKPWTWEQCNPSDILHLLKIEDKPSIIKKEVSTAHHVYVDALLDKQPGDYIKMIKFIINPYGIWGYIKNKQFHPVRTVPKVNSMKEAQINWLSPNKNEPLIKPNGQIIGTKIEAGISCVSFSHAQALIEFIKNNSGPNEVFGEIDINSLPFETKNRLIKKGIKKLNSLFNNKSKQPIPPNEMIDAPIFDGKSKQTLCNYIATRLKTIGRLFIIPDNFTDSPNRAKFKNFLVYLYLNRSDVVEINKKAERPNQKITATNNVTTVGLQVLKDFTETFDKNDQLEIKTKFGF